MILRNILKNSLRSIGLDLVRYRPRPLFPPDFSQRDIEIISSVMSYTLTSVERLWALMQAVRYINEARIPGSIVECGVWRGGSMMAAAHVLLDERSTDRELYLFDTYEGMVQPTEADVTHSKRKASDVFEQRKFSTSSSDWCYAAIEEVQMNLTETGYDSSRTHFIKGKVEETIPSTAPDRIALLRLDTDWYESTLHELTHLYPRLSPGGVLIIDDYGHWEGARKATDEFFASAQAPILLNRIDYTGRIAIKPY